MFAAYIIRTALCGHMETASTDCPFADAYTDHGSRVHGFPAVDYTVPFYFSVCLVLAVTPKLLGLPAGEYDHGVIHSVSCDTGYSLIGGASSITCSDGSWVPAEVNCFRGIVEEVRNASLENHCL